MNKCEYCGNELDDGENICFVCEDRLLDGYNDKLAERALEKEEEDFYESSFGKSKSDYWR